MNASAASVSPCRKDDAGNSNLCLIFHVLQRRERHSRQTTLYRYSRFALFICLSMVAIPSYATIYKFEDHANRMTIYSNMPIRPIAANPEPPKTTPSKPLTATPLPSPPPPPPIQESEVMPQQSPASPPPSGTNVNVKPTAPVLKDSTRIPAVVQRIRDSERLSILHHELQLEQAALADALSRKAPEEFLHRHRTNIDALKREIASTR